MGKNQDPVSVMNSQIIFPRAEKQFLGLKILKFFDTDPDTGSGSFWPWIRDRKIRIGDTVSGINIPDSRH
jgi:hypothetical protein